MLIDNAIEMLEESTTDVPEDTEAKELLTLLTEAQAYDVGGVTALLSHMKKRERLESFLDTESDAEDPACLGQIRFSHGADGDVCQLLVLRWCRHGELLASDSTAGEDSTPGNVEPGLRRRIPMLPALLLLLLLPCKR